MDCKKGAAALIDSIISTITLLDEDLYSKPLEIYNGSTFGKHFRHIHDFFHCLTHQCNNNMVDYCKRCRNTDIEENKYQCIEAFKELKHDLSDLDEEKIIDVRADFEIEPGIRPEVKTSLGREIMYAYDHAVHHLAIVKIGLNKHCSHLAISQELGVAASTIRYNSLG